MRWLTGLVVGFMVVWGGYWGVGSRALERGATAWLDGLPANGIPAAYSALTVQGFPNRFDLILSDPVLGDPAALQWRAAFFHLLALSYRPYNLIAVWPDSQQIITPAQTMTLTNQSARASVLFTPTPSLPLDHLELVVDQGALASDTGWQTTFGQLRFATRQVIGQQNAHQIGLDIIGLAPDAALRQAIDPDTTLPDTVTALHLDVTAAFNAPLDRFAFGNGGFGLESLTLAGLRLEWGPMMLAADGTLTRDSAGFAQGQIVIHLRDWPRMVALAQASGLLDPINAGNISRALQVLAGMDTDGGDLDVPLGFSDGRMVLAGLPLLAAPRF